MTCRTVDQGVLDSAKSLEDVYSQLGVLRNPNDLSVLAPPAVILPDGIAQATFPYLEGAEGRDFNLSALFGNNKEGLNCVLSSLHYDEKRAAEIDAEVRIIEQEGGSVDDYLAGLGVGDRRSYSTYTTLALLDYFRGTAADGTSGNSDGKQDVLSLNELSTWAWEACGKTTPADQQAVAATAIARFHALLGLAGFLQSEPIDTSGNNGGKTGDVAPGKDPGTGEGAKETPSSPNWDAFVAWAGRNWIYAAVFGGSLGLGFLISHFSQKSGWKKGFQAGFTKGKEKGMGEAQEAAGVPNGRKTVEIPRVTNAPAVVRASTAPVAPAPAPDAMEDVLNSLSPFATRIEDIKLSELPAETVVMRQIAALYPKAFLTEDGTALRAEAQPLLQQWSLAAIEAYKQKFGSTPDAVQVRAAWTVEIGKGQKIVKGGIPHESLVVLTHGLFQNYKDHQGQRLSQQFLGDLVLGQEEAMRRRGTEATPFEKRFSELMK